MFKRFKNMSRLKKKLLIYFILIAIVSISVSAEMILEISSSKFQKSVIQKFYEQIQLTYPKDKIGVKYRAIDVNKVYSPIINLRNRMILFLIVIAGAIGMAFILFAKDIVYPMDVMVDATKKITAGDLTVNVPVFSKDEIGQIAGLINDMNINLQDVLLHMQHSLESYCKYIRQIEGYLKQSINIEKDKKIIKNKRMKKNDFINIMEIQNSIYRITSNMNKELASMSKFIEMFHTYTIPEEITQEEIELTLEHYKGKE